jgi:hypothetical protein
MGRVTKERAKRERKMKVLIKISVSCHYHSLILVFHFLTLNKYGKYIYFCQGEIIIFFLPFLVLSLCLTTPSFSSPPFSIIHKNSFIAARRRGIFLTFSSQTTSVAAASSSSRSKYSGIYIAEPCENFCRNRII